MHIAVDVSAVRLPGPRVYCAGFLPALAGLLNAGDELTVFGPDDIEGIVCPLVGPRIRFVGNPMLKRVPARIWWQQFTLPGLLKSIRADVLFEPFDMGPWHGHCPMVVGIRNPNPVILDGGVVAMTRQERMFGRVHKFLVSNACRRAKLLIFPSRVLPSNDELPSLNRRKIWWQNYIEWPLRLCQQKADLTHFTDHGLLWAAEFVRGGGGSRPFTI